MKAFQSIPAKLEKLGNGHCIAIAATTAAALISKGHQRVLCTINGAHTVHAALIPRKAQGDYYIYAGKTLLQQLSLSAGDVLSITLEPDESDYQFDMPEELAEVLATDAEAHRIFHALSPGRQRGLIQLVVLVKSTTKRIERALTITDKIKAGITSPQAVLK